MTLREGNVEIDKYLYKTQNYFPLKNRHEIHAIALLAILAKPNIIQ